MYMILHLHNERYLDDVLMALTEAGIDDTVVLSGQLAGQKLTFENPLFAGFRQSMVSENTYPKIIMGYARKEQVDFMLAELKSSDIDFLGDNIGKIALFPVEHLYDGSPTTS